MPVLVKAVEQPGRNVVLSTRTRQGDGGLNMYHKLYTFIVIAPESNAAGASFSRKGDKQGMSVR
jgi:hypothetical protein